MTKFNKFCQGAWFYHIETLCKYLISVAESCDQFHGPAFKPEFFYFPCCERHFWSEGHGTLVFCTHCSKSVYLSILLLVSL